MVLYRILSLLVNIFCVLLAFITVFGIIYAIANPAALLQCFLFIGTVLYGWFANRFRIQVILRKQSISKRHKDWLQVNAIVAFIFSLLAHIASFGASIVKFLFFSIFFPAISRRGVQHKSV